MEWILDREHAAMLVQVDANGGHPLGLFLADDFTGVKGGTPLGYPFLRVPPLIRAKDDHQEQGMPKCK